MSTSTKTRYNWAPVIESIVRIVQECNITIISADNGEFETKVPEGASPEFVRRLMVYNLNACDEGRLYVKTPGCDRLRWLFIVLGNEPEETICDYIDCPEIDLAFSTFTQEWEGKKTPTMPYDAPYETEEPKQ